MKKLILTALVALALVAGFAVPQAKALGIGSLGYNTCPPQEPYLHVTFFGSAYCSMYP